jgi:phage terminase large subunit
MTIEKNTLKLQIPAKLGELFSGDARYRVAHGGRGSAKSWSIAQMLIVKAHEKPRRILCARELQKSIKDSSHKLISDTIERIGLSKYFEIGESFIRHKNGSDFIFKGLKHSPDEIKSTEGVDICWVEEAQRITKKSFDILIPTIRKSGSELWFSFNPENEEDEIYKRFVLNNPPPQSKVIKIDWNDNPWFPKELEDERVHCQETNPEDYEHIWNGAIRRLLEGSYYNKQLESLRDKGRITSCAYNPSFPVDTYWDIGFSDYTSIWFVQKVGLEFRLIDYLQNNGEHPEYYAKELKAKNYNYRAHYLPHDAKHTKFGMTKSIEQQLETILKGDYFYTKAGFNINSDIQATRMFFPRCVFDEVNCEEGLKALRNYKKKFNDEKGHFEDKPYHDWASHASDAFRYFAMENIDVNDMAHSYDYDHLVSNIVTINIEAGFNDYI